MNYYIFVTGCQQNIYDSEKITHLFEKMGYFKSNEEMADLIIAVACSVRQKPVDRVFGKLKIWNKLPKKPKIIIVGCVLPKDKIKLKEKVDAIIDSKDIEKKLEPLLHCLIAPLLKNKKNHIQNNSRAIGQLNTSTLLGAGNYVPIMFGCNNFCSYCAVPYTRGREISRPEKDIITEIENKVKNGKTEIMLLGQNVNSYHPELKTKIEKLPPGQSPLGEGNTITKNLKQNKSPFAKLLNKIEKINGLKKISFMTSHPKDMSGDLIEWMAKSSKFSRELHLPVQSGDDEVLKKMNRGYSAENFINLVKKLKAKSKKLKLSTDIIVGFPGETKKQFENTVKLCKNIHFVKAYVSQYSPRPGTPAAKLKDNVSSLEKKRRWEIINDLINKKRVN